MNDFEVILLENGLKGLKTAGKTTLEFCRVFRVRWPFRLCRS
jgi:hypothetical protein